MVLNFKSYGDGQAVIILHGLLGSLDNWQTHARRLSSEFKVYAVDLRNHGKSPHSDIHNYPVMAEDLLDFLDEHKIGKAHVIGHSMGGKAAMQFAISHPERVLKLMVVDISPRSYESGHDLIFKALSEIDLTKISKREEADAMLTEQIPEPAMRQFLLKNLDRTPEGLFAWKMNLQGLTKNYAKINIPIESDTAIKIPAMVIRGGKSGYVKDADLQSFRNIFPETQLLTIANSGHWVHADAPDEFYKEVRQFLLA